MSTKADALLKINEFEKRKVDPSDFLKNRPFGTDWTNIQKDKLIDGMKKRLDNPDLISTRVVNLCGPGAFFRCLIVDDPVMYVQAVIGLFENNLARIGSRTFKAGPSLLKAMPASGMDQVDWVPLASLRDDENTVLSYDDAGGGLSGLTMPSGLAKWFTQAGYTDVKNDTSVTFATKGSKNPAHLKAASDLRKSGYRVCLLISAKMLKNTEQAHASMYPDHWVVLMSDVTVSTDDLIDFKVHSWGQVMSVPVVHAINDVQIDGVSVIKIPGTTRDPIDADDLCKNYYGYVAAKPPGSS
jgi:hypothetical protein